MATEILPEKKAPLPEMIGFQMLDIRAAIENPPEKGYVWEFDPDRPTWLQTDSSLQGECRWYLTQEQGDDPEYHIDVPPDPAGVLNVLAHLADKSWSDPAQLFRAMLPAIRAAAGWR